MLACDFFHVDCAISLSTDYVFFVIGIASRYVHILGATTNPDGRGPPSKLGISWLPLATGPDE